MHPCQKITHEENPSKHTKNIQTHTFRQTTKIPKQHWNQPKPEQNQTWHPEKMEQPPGRTKNTNIQTKTPEKGHKNRNPRQLSNRMHKLPYLLLRTHHFTKTGRKKENPPLTTPTYQGGCIRLQMKRQSPILSHTHLNMYKIYRFCGLSRNLTSIYW